MIEISYRAAVLQNEEVRRKADKIGHHLAEMDESKSRRPALYSRMTATLAGTGANIREALSSSVRRVRPAEG